MNRADRIEARLPRPRERRRRLLGRRRLFARRRARGAGSRRAGARRDGGLAGPRDRGARRSTSVAAAIGIAHERSRPPSSSARATVERPRSLLPLQDELYDRLAALAEARGYAAVLSGANADDVGDWRPGLRLPPSTASPPVARGRDRQGGGASCSHGARGSERGQARVTCLASRLPYGTPVEPADARPGRPRRAGAQAPRVSRAASASLRRARAGAAGGGELPRALSAHGTDRSSRRCAPRATTRSRSTRSRFAPDR